MPPGSRDDERRLIAAVEEREGAEPTRELKGLWAWITAFLAGGLALFGLWWTQFSLSTVTYRAGFLLAALALVFLLHPGRKRDAERVRGIDLAWIAALCASLAYLIWHQREAIGRAVRPLDLELVLGTVLILATLEGTRRAAGWMLPLLTAGFLGYAYLGESAPEPWDHRGYSWRRIVGQNYLTLEGLFGPPLDVAATFIVLFTILGAVLECSGAGRFYLEWAFALFNRSAGRTAPARATIAGGFLLGTVSGSGVATTVTLGTLAWPMLRQAGYPAAVAAGLLAASGIGATLSPPTLGAAAFLLAEYLDISYARVLAMAIVPTILFYAGCWWMVEGDANRLSLNAHPQGDRTAWQLFRQRGYHLSTLLLCATLLGLGMTPFLAAFWSIVWCWALSLVGGDDRLASARAAVAGFLAAAIALGLGARLSVAAFVCVIGAMLADGAGSWLNWGRRNAPGIRGHPDRAEPPGFAAALVDGGRAVAGITAACACAGLIVSAVNLTGLGLKLSGLLVELGGGNRAGTVILAALAMWLLGTAIPVTASYVIAAVTLAPALISVGVPPAAAHMFLFYYAVLADVSPPTALAPFAAAAITGADALASTLQAWRFCLPAFVVPLFFCLAPGGDAVLVPGGLLDLVHAAGGAALAVMAFGVAASGWPGRPTPPSARILAAGAGMVWLLASWQTGAAPALLAASWLAGRPRR